MLTSYLKVMMYLNAYISKHTRDINMRKNVHKTNELLIIH